MARRCPQSQYIGIARLSGFKWIINSRGYANVVELSLSTGHSDLKENRKDAEDANNVVWGLVYKLSESDEQMLDMNEGVPESYTKEYLPVEFWASQEPFPAPFEGASDERNRIDVGANTGKKLDMLVYIDRKRVEDSVSRKEYVVRMNEGIRDAIAVGVPTTYVDNVLRKFIPDDEARATNDVKKLAMKQAGHFEDKDEQD
jgi:gamma-glutamylcyclotransferase